MLDGIRKAANNWLGRIVLIVIMSILILSFAIWGIGDMLRVQTNTVVASVGKTTIDAETVRRNYTTALEDLSQRARRRVTNDEARALGLDRQVLDRLISEAALDQNARDLGLHLADADVARITMAEPAFKGANGAFDRQVFYELLRRNGMNEAFFFAEQKRSLLRREIAEALGGDAVPSQTLMDAAYRFVSEQRTAKAITLTPAMLGALPAADDAALKAFYDNNKAQFRAPDYRKVVLLAAMPDALGIDLTVTDDDLRRVYERVLATGRLGTPEKRQVRQVLFADAAEASAAAEMLKAGTTFDALMDVRKVKPADADLGLKARSDFADPAIAAAAFALEDGAVSAPVKTAFGAALIQLVKIEKGTEIPFDIAKTTLAETAQADKLRTDPKVQARLDDIQKKVEEAKIAGKSLTEAAPLAGLAVAVIEAVDAAGRDKAGKAVALPGGEETLKAIYQSDIGLDNEALHPRTGGLVWFEIAAVEPARDRPFDEVKADVMLRWQADETARRLAARAGELVAKIDGGADVAAVAAEIGAEVKDVTVTRQNGGELGQTAASQAFAVAVGKATSASLGGDRGRVILKVLEAKAGPLDPSSGVGQQYLKQIGDQLEGDLVAQYIGQLKARYGATENARMLQTAIGGNTGG